MKRYFTSKKYAHISVSSLHLLAQRNGELFCSVDTWYKYIRFYGWNRPWKKVRRLVLKKGIRASRSNEIWHLDVTVVNIRPGYKLYIQAVIDNFSRFVLAWQVTEAISAKNTVETLRLAKIKGAELLKTDITTNVMMDPGTENRNGHVLDFITSKNLTRTLARVDVHYSNSMIESLFRMLKNNYLYHQGIRCMEDLERKAAFYFRAHNQEIPLSGHKGGRPEEIFLSSWGEIEKGELEKKKQEAFLKRRQKNMELPCEVCPGSSGNIQC